MRSVWSWVVWVAVVAALSACDASGGAADGVADAVTADGVGVDAADTVTADTVTAGDDATIAPDSVAPLSCTDEAVTVTLYDDGNGASTSHYDQPLGTDDRPITGARVRLLSAGGVTRVALDCGPGRYGFVDLPAGWHALEVDLAAESTSNNHGRRLPAAIAEGAVKVVTFGDSIPHFGPTPWFPAQLATMLAPLASVANVNVAVPGSRTVDWLPNTGNFDHTLAPQLGDADVIVFSLGGNDLTELATEANIASVDEALALLDDLDAELIAIEANLVTIYEALRLAAPDADILWLLYPNYAMSDAWAQYIGSYQDLATALMESKLVEVRYRMAQNDGLMIADMLGSVDKPALDAFLWDELHLNVAGSRHYASEVFVTLGGVFVDPAAPRGLNRHMGFSP